MHDQNSEKMKKELEELVAKLNANDFKTPETREELAKRYTELRETLEIQEKIEGLAKKIGDAEEIVRESGDQELIALAQEDLKNLHRQKEEIEEKSAQESAGNTISAMNEVILEIRAGVGGDEAALFAGEILRMYSRFAEKNGWKFLILSQSQTELGGIKEAIAEIRGRGIYKKLHYESGVHRIQRIPETEKTGRIHTSTASVAVLPKAKPIDIEIRPDEVRMEAFRASGPGGQYVNKTSSAVRITHIPTGATVASQAGRSQAENREIAMTILRTRLLEERVRAQEKKIKDARQKQIGSGDRSEKIRTYNFPQDRLTDHRIKKSWHNLVSILNGNLEPILDAIAAAEEDRAGS